MSKFTEIIEKLKATGISVEDFAYEYIPHLDVFSDAALEAQRLLDEWLKNNPNPGYGEEGHKEWIEKYDKLPSKYTISVQEWKKDNNLPEWKEIEQYGGEDMGSTWYSIKYFPELDLYIKVSGWYQSYHGTDFSDWDSACKEVRPQQKTITVYE